MHLQIPATALCSVLMLNRSLSRTQWFSIALLSIGVGIVQLASSTADQAYHSHSDDIPEKSELLYGPGNNSTGNAILDSRAIHEIGKGHVEMNQMLGLMAVILACLSSGFSSVFFEKQLKRAPAPLPSSASAGADSSNSNRDPSESNHSQQTTTRKTGLWIRNIQLSMFSLLVGSTIYAITSPNDIPDFLIGFAPIVWFVVFVQIVGGLLAALVIQYADNIAKSFSTSCSIILSFAVSIAFFDFRLSLGVIIGSTAVMLATWLFSKSLLLFLHPSSGFVDEHLILI